MFGRWNEHHLSFANVRWSARATTLDALPLENSTTGAPAKPRTAWIARNQLWFRPVAASRRMNLGSG